MFQGFARVWTVATAQKLAHDRPLAVTVAGERIVFFRDREGRARALLDRCPHRGVALSLGTVRDGCIACPFHGWRFDGEGRACEVPYNPDAKRELLGATAIPCEERVGMLWIYTAPCEGGVAPEPFELPGLLGDTSLTHVVDELVWDTHWTRAMENMLDWPHLPFVHRTTIGAALARELKPGTRMDILTEPNARGVVSTSTLDGEARPGGLDWVQPNMMVLHISSEKRVFEQCVACVPIDDGHTRMVLTGSRGFLKSAVFNPLFRWSNRRIAAQDKAVVESSWPAEIPDGGAEVSVRTDRLPLLFRKYFHERLKPSSAEAPRRGLKVVRE